MLDISKFMLYNIKYEIVLFCYAVHRYKSKLSKMNRGEK